LKLPGGLIGGDGGNGKSSSSLSQMSAQRSGTSPATEQSELTGELPITVLAALPISEDLKLEL
jgi:hypothetical protein